MARTPTESDNRAQPLFERIGRGEQLDLLDRVKLPPVQGVRPAMLKSILRRVEAYARGGQGCYATRETIAAAVDCSEKTVRRAIAALVEMRVLTRHTHAMPGSREHRYSHRIDWTQLGLFDGRLALLSNAAMQTEYQTAERVANTTASNGHADRLIDADQTDIWTDQTDTLSRSNGHACPFPSKPKRSVNNPPPAFTVIQQEEEFLRKEIPEAARKRWDRKPSEPTPLFDAPPPATPASSASIPDDDAPLRTERARQAAHDENVAARKADHERRMQAFRDNYRGAQLTDAEMEAGLSEYEVAQRRAPTPEIDRCNPLWPRYEREKMLDVFKSRGMQAAEKCLDHAIVGGWRPEQVASLLDELDLYKKRGLKIRVSDGSCLYKRIMDGQWPFKKPEALEKPVETLTRTEARRSNLLQEMDAAHAKAAQERHSVQQRDNRYGPWLDTRPDDVVQALLARIERSLLRFYGRQAAQRPIPPGMVREAVMLVIEADDQANKGATDGR